jgi:hypothetical protein
LNAESRAGKVKIYFTQSSKLVVDTCGCMAKYGGLVLSGILHIEIVDLTVSFQLSFACIIKKSAVSESPGGYFYSPMHNTNSLWTITVGWTSSFKGVHSTVSVM